MHIFIILINSFGMTIREQYMIRNNMCFIRLIADDTFLTEHMIGQTKEHHWSMEQYIWQ